MAVAISQTANPDGVSANFSSPHIATYTSVAIGTAATDRIVVVVVGTEGGGAPTSCTIDGNSMNAGNGGAGGNVQSGLFWLPYPTGTTATIVVNYVNYTPSTANHIAVYKIIGASLTNVTTGSDISYDMDSSDPLTTGSNTIDTGGGFLAVVAGDTEAGEKTWANTTEDIDADVGSFRFTTSKYTTAGTATRTCTGTLGGEDGALSWILFNQATPSLSPSTSPTLLTLNVG